jgi:hypothetical protein
MPVNKNEIRKDVLAKAMQCKTADELMELAKAEGFAITKDEAEAYFAELSDIELDAKTLKNVAGGGGMCWENFKFKLD